MGLIIVPETVQDAFDANEQNENNDDLMHWLTEKEDRTEPPS
jgi:hypothetical protein